MCSSDVNRECHSVFTISNRLEPRPACVAALHSWIHGSDTRTRVELSVAPKRLARLVLLRLVLLLLRRFGVDRLLVPLDRGLQLGRVVLRSLVPYALDELAARVNGAGVYATESHLEGVPVHLELPHVALGPSQRDTTSARMA